MSYYLLDNPNPNHSAARPHYYVTRRQPIRIIVLHTAENLPDWTGQDSGAEAVARYASRTTRQVSWHSTVDSDSIVTMLPDSYTGFHVRGYNSPSLGVEMATRASRWSDAPAGWVDGIIGNLATVLREWSATNEIPLHRIARANVDAGRKGIVAHSDLDPGRRTDPGQDFPWDLLWTKLGQEDDIMFCKYRDGFGVAGGDPKVRYWQQLLGHLGRDTGGIDGKYGDATKAAVIAVAGGDGQQIGPDEASKIDIAVAAVSQSTVDDVARGQASQAHQRLNKLHDI